MLKNFDYEVPKSEDCILIDINNWLSPKDTLISIQKLNGRTSTTFVTEALKTNIKNSSWQNIVKEGDVVLLSRVASEIAPYRSFSLENERQYFNAPVSQVMGIFENKEVSLENLKMVNDKILIKKIEDTQDSAIALMNSNVMIGEVIKVGDTLRVQEGDIILVRDNVSTEIILNNEKFHALEERMVVGIFHDSFALENMEFLNESVLMKPYTSKKLLNSNLLITPDIDLTELDYSDIYNRDLFKIYFLDKNLSKLSKGNVVLVNRDYTNYVYFNQEKYFIINGYEYIESVIKE